MEALLQGFAVTLSLDNLFYCFVGVLLGTVVGILPGLGPSGLRIYKQTSFGVKGERLSITTSTHEFSMQLDKGHLIEDIFIKA